MTEKKKEKGKHNPNVSLPYALYYQIPSKYWKSTRKCHSAVKIELLHKILFNF